ncbi:MAG: radical SAM protein [Betaproteobacteria bacterium]|nr:MAG: radical SAM protein [Betaproteobacteria bacterium]
MTIRSVAASPPLPCIISWNLTRRCNLACAHCYLDAVLRKTEARDELDTQESLAVIRQLAQAAPGAMLVLTGGEPLLRRDLTRLVKAASGDGLMAVVGTNGTLLDTAQAEALREAGAAGVGISLDSAAPQFHDRLRGRQGAWASACCGIAVARSAGLAVVVQTTVFEENRRDLPALADLAEREGAMAFNVFFLVCTGRGVTQTDLASASYEETLREIVQLQHKHPSLKMRARCAPYMRRVQGLHAGESGYGYADWSSACLAGRRYFRITPQGRVTPCPYIPAVVGDLRTQPLQQIWNEHPTLRSLRNELPGGKCGVCDFRYSCGGCRARALAQHGELLAQDSKCGYIVPPDRRPEEMPEIPQRPRVEWETDAQARLLSIPAFVRDRVRTLLEASAIGEGVDTITVEFLMNHRPPADLLDRLRARIGRRAGGGTIVGSE